MKSLEIINKNRKAIEEIVIDNWKTNKNGDHVIELNDEWRDEHYNKLYGNFEHKED